jgi:hypothetical protein
MAYSGWSIALKNNINDLSSLRFDVQNSDAGFFIHPFPGLTNIIVLNNTAVSNPFRFNILVGATTDLPQN